MTQEMQKTKEYLIQEWRLLISAFFAGTGIVMWVVTFIFNPVNKINSTLNVYIASNDQVIQKLTETVTELKNDAKENQSRNMEIQTRITRIEAILDGTR